MYALDDLATLTCIEVEHAQSSHISTRSGCGGKSQAENARFEALVSDVQQFQAHRNQFFADIYQFVIVTARTDA